MSQPHNTQYTEKPMTTYGRTQGPSRRYRRLRHPIFLSTEWTAKNPLLQRGEIGVESDTHKVKVGDGLTYWNSLQYVVADAEGQPKSTDNYQVGNEDGEWTTLSVAQQDALNSGANTTNIAQIGTNTTNIGNHIADTNNPHSVTKTQVGLGNVDNTSDIDKPISTATQNALDLKANTDDLATVATTGNYNDLSNKPTIPAAQVNSDWDAVSGVAQILNKPTLGTAAAADTTDFATAAQGALADTAIQPGDNVSDLANDAGYLTSVGFSDITGLPEDNTALSGALDAKVGIGHQVIDFQTPTALNNYTWYRKYADGWVEQGGIYDNGSSVQTKSANITLPIAMADTNYTVIDTPSRGTVVNTSTSMMTGTHSKTTTGFSITWLGINTADTVQFASWYVCGMAA